MVQYNLKNATFLKHVADIVKIKISV